MFLPLLLLVTGMLQAATVNPCPEGFKPEERTVVVYATNQSPNSKAFMHQHYKNLVQLFRKNNVRTALPLFQVVDSQRIFVYAVASEAETKKMVQLDPLIAKNHFTHKFEAWIECKSVTP